MPEHTAVIPSILESDAETVLKRIGRLPGRCSLVEIRGDFLSSKDLSRVVARCGREVVVTVRMKQEGGSFPGSESERKDLLLTGLQAGAAYADVPVDSPAAVQGLVPRERLILSWHGNRRESDPLPKILSRMRAMGAALYKLVPLATGVECLQAIRDFLQEISPGGPAVICFAAGRYGAQSRILAPSWGSRWTFGYPPGGEPTAEGQFPAADLLEIYDVQAIGSRTRIFGLLGRDLAGSPSPAMHNAAFRDLGLDARYLPMAVDSMRDLEVLSAPDGPVGAEGFGVTMPFKGEAAARSADLDRWSAAAGAVNTLVQTAGGWHGRNTDAMAIQRLVGSVLSPRDRRVLVYGAGGLARGAVVVLRDAGALVTLYGRNPDRVRQVAAELGVDAVPAWPDRVGADILVNATPAGRDGQDWPAAWRLPAKLVLDASYGRKETDLVRKAREAGLAVVSGKDLILAQAVDQFHLLAGSPPRQEVMAAALERWFAGDPA